MDVHCKIFSILLCTYKLSNVGAGGVEASNKFEFRSPVSYTFLGKETLRHLRKSSKLLICSLG